jgi:hypothetical protein
MTAPECRVGIERYVGGRWAMVVSTPARSRPKSWSWSRTASWLGGLAELRRFHELADGRPLWLEVHLDGVPDGLITIVPQEV